MNETLIEKVRLRRQLPEPTMRRVIRELAGLSLAEVGAALEVAPATVSRWEAGTRRPTGELLDAYVRLLMQLATEVQ